MPDELELPLETLRARPSRKWTLFPADVLPAWIADMDYAAPAAIQRALTKLVAEQNYGYAWGESDKALRDSFANRMQRRYAWEIDPARIQPVADLVQGMNLAVSAFTEPGDGVIVQNPIYPPFLATIDGTKRRRVYNPLADTGSGFVVDVAGLERAAGEARAIMVCNPHNPTGRVLTRDELEVVGRIAVEHDLTIVCDEIHADLVYSGHQHVPLASLSSDIAVRTVTLSSATKSFNIAGLRCGLMYFGSEQLLERFRDRIPRGQLGAVNIAGLEATVAAWREGDEWLERVIALLARNRARLADWARGYGDAIKHYSPEGTYLAWLECAGLGLPVPPRDFFLEHARVGLNPGADFGPGGETCVRLNFATSASILEDILRRMNRAIDAQARGTLAM
ncbi:MAG: PatB family C-S lyase [Chloroflexi bacterium]|nr:PatB family C-S lyase [Chloroflexota bacterium]